MNIIHNGRLYLFNEFSDDKYKLYFTERCWFLVKIKNQEIKNQEIKNQEISDEEAFILSNIYIAMEYLGCRYPSKIENKIRNIIKCI